MSCLGEKLKIVMNITQLSIQNFRNIQSVNIKLHPRFNLLIGDNGAGKTSVLEAIHFLSLGRSFRSKQLNRIIKTGKPEFVLFAKNEHSRIGLSRHISGEAKLKLNGDLLQGHVLVTQQFPVLLFNPESFQLFTDGSRPRRQLIDWGIFYQDRQFLPVWHQYKKGLQQRNAALKTNQNAGQVQLWDAILIKAAQKIDQLRAAYIEQIKEALGGVIGSFIQQQGIELQYYRGWSREKELQQVLQEDLQRDQQLGFTHHGPHRADLRLRAKSKPAQEVLSRGQQKVLVCGLKLAQGLLLQQQTGKQCVYLLDDIASELDVNNRELLLNYLRQLNAQVMLTSIDKSIGQYFQENENTIFQVSSGGVLMIS